MPYSTQEERDRAIADLMGSTPEQVRREREEMARAYREYLKSPQFKELGDKLEAAAADPVWQAKFAKASQIVAGMQAKYFIPQETTQNNNQKSPIKIRSNLSAHLERQSRPGSLAGLASTRHLSLGLSWALLVVLGLIFVALHSFLQQ